MSLIINYVICVICISKKLKYLKNEARESKTGASVAQSSKQRPPPTEVMGSSSVSNM